MSDTVIVETQGPPVVLEVVSAGPQGPQGPIGTVTAELTALAAAASASATAAAASYDSFDDRYLGAKATAPTLDNDGNALLTGALYWNTTSSQMFVRSSSASWINYEATSVAAAATATTQAGIATTQATTATTQAGTATTQAGIATTQAGIATTQAGLAATAKTAAETARDAAYGNANVYASTAAGLAATTNGQQFQVVVGTDILRYRNDSGAATLVAQYPSSGAVNSNLRRLIAQETAYVADLFSRTVGKASPVAGTTGGAGTYFFTGRPAVAGSISSVSIYGAAQTVKLKVYRPSAIGGTAYTMAYEVSLVLQAGLNTFSVANGTLGEYLTKDGDVLGVYFPTSVQYNSVAGSTGYTAFGSTDKTDGATFDNLGDVGGIELQLGIVISAASSDEIAKTRALDNTLSRSFSVGEKNPVAPSPLQYMATGNTVAWDWVFKSAALLNAITVSAQTVGVGKIIVLEPYEGGYRAGRSVQVRFASGVSTLVAGVDFPSDILVPKNGLIAFKVATSNSLHQNVFDALQRFRVWYGDATDGIFPSYKWPAGLEHLSGIVSLSGNPQIRFDFTEAVDLAKLNEQPQYIVRELFTGSNGPVTLLGDAWTKGAGKISSGTVGIANGLVWAGGNTHLTDFKCRWRFAFTAADTAVYFYKRPLNQAQGSIVGLSMTTGNITLYNTLDSAGNIGSVNTARACTLTLATGRDYTAVLDKAYRDWTLTITDTVTGASDAISWDGDASAAAGFAYGTPGIAVASGSLDLTEFAAWSGVKSPKVLLFGDSITEGSGASVISDSWAYKVCQAVGGNSSPRGGDAAATIVLRTLFELNAFPAVRYAIFLMGTNDTDMTIWQRAVDNVAKLCQTFGVTPIFGTLPPEAADSNPVSVQNPYIRSSGYRFIDFARALTVGNDGTTRDSSKFADTLHPNTAGHLAMYNRVRLDVPELFD